MGAGIGRVTLHVLAPSCERVDLLEPVSSLLRASQSFLAPVADRIGQRFALPLQTLSDPASDPVPNPTPNPLPLPLPGSYSLVWVQWAALYLLRDAAVVRALRACAALLVRGGVLVLKENVTRGARGFVSDASDASVTRAPSHWLRLFAAAELCIVKEERVKGFPSALFPVHQWALTRSDDHAPATT